MTKKTQKTTKVKADKTEKPKIKITPEQLLEIANIQDDQVHTFRNPNCEMLVVRTGPLIALKKQSLKHQPATQSNSLASKQEQ